MASAVGLVDYGGDSEVQQDGRCVSRYFQKYLVRTDSPNLLTPQQVAGLVGITRGAPLDYDTNATCYRASVSLGPTMTRPPHMAYYVTFEFATNAPKPEEDTDDPTAMRTKWSISPQIQSRYVIEDKNGLIVNAAGDPYDGGIPVDVRLGSVTAKKNRIATGYDIDAALANSGKLNSTPFLGGAPGTVQVDISAEEVYEGGYHYWAETYVFSYNPLGWQPKPLNAGLYRLDGDDKKRITHRDVGGDDDEFVEEPEPLDEDGDVIPPGPAHRPAECNFIDVEYYDEMDFNTFGLGTPGS